VFYSLMESFCPSFITNGGNLSVLVIFFRWEFEMGIRQILPNSALICLTGVKTCQIYLLKQLGHFLEGNIHGNCHFRPNRCKSQVILCKSLE